MPAPVPARGLGRIAMGLDDRTSKAVGDKVMERLRSLRFCIVGCGGTGANFAEMLVRTGATRLALIDGAVVKEEDLNRVFSFSFADVGEPKVKVLETRLESIRTGLEICALRDSFRRREEILKDHPIGQRVRDVVHDADVVFIATDTNTSRIAIESLCLEKSAGKFLSCGVLVDRKSGIFEFECNWSPTIPAARADDVGYGPDNASFASIVHEATSIAFTMLLSHLTCADSGFKSYVRRYDASLQPIKTVVNGKSSDNIASCSMTI